MMKSVSVTFREKTAVFSPLKHVAPPEDGPHRRPKSAKDKNDKQGSKEKTFAD